MTDAVKQKIIKYTSEEKQKFTQGVKLYGKNWRKVSEYIKTLTYEQVYGYAKQLIKKI